ncbi:Neutral zinc metallopeptidase [Phytophthora megakarya]|uniref:Neutral zinc metallopeptidase n=1 Tax=Phytophthora megakarya TaxID=4795 RepID=A0A225WUC4_9STRA|nr:Neutral zinc metallopeptidase [Phytophthora megakarya]
MTTSFAIGEVKALVRQPRRAEAQQLLERLAAAVLPILTRRRFRVRRLLEFFPKDGALLGMNVNRGAKIYVRRTPKQTVEYFYPYEALLETLLHELTHMVHGPHNQAFYQYLDELKQEMESLMIRGLVGQEGVNFAGAGAGQRLGGNNASVPIRVAAVLAAKRREQFAAWRRNESPARINNRNVLREGVPHEVLGIESSDDDDKEASKVDDDDGETPSEVIELLEDEDVASRTPVTTTSREDTRTIINLLDGDEDESDELAGTIDRESAANRKRKRQDTSDIIDLT